MTDGVDVCDWYNCFSNSRHLWATGAAAGVERCGFGDDCSSSGSGEKSKRSSKLTASIVAINCCRGEKLWKGRRRRMGDDAVTRSVNKSLLNSEN